MAPWVKNALTLLVFGLLLTSCARGLASSTFSRGASAPLYLPSGIAFDSRTNAIFVTNTYDCTIARFTTRGQFKTIAGKSGHCGYADGTGAVARFYYPAGITYDATADRFFITDTQNCTIRSMSPTGDVTTLAGSNLNCAFANGQGSSAYFFYPSGIAYDDADNAIYVTDTMNCAIRKITMAGVVTTVAGDQFACRFMNGTGASAAFRYPSGITYDTQNGDMYVTDTLNCAIRLLTPSGTVTTVAGGPGRCSSIDGPNTIAAFSYPTGIDYRTKYNDVVVTDTDDCSLRRISPRGWTTTIVGTDGQCGFANGSAGKALFSYPARIADNPETGAVYITDTANCAIRELSGSTPSDSRSLTTIASRPNGCNTSVHGNAPISGVLLTPPH